MLVLQGKKNFLKWETEFRTQLGLGTSIRIQAENTLELGRNDGLLRGTMHVSHLSQEVKKDSNWSLVSQSDVQVQG